MTVFLAHLSTKCPSFVVIHLCPSALSLKQPFLLKHLQDFDETPHKYFQVGTLPECSNGSDEWQIV